MKNIAKNIFLTLNLSLFLFLFGCVSDNQEQNSTDNGKEGSAISQSEGENEQETGINSNNTPHSYEEAWTEKPEQKKDTSIPPKAETNSPEKTSYEKPEHLKNAIRPVDGPKGLTYYEKDGRLFARIDGIEFEPLSSIQAPSKIWPYQKMLVLDFKEKENITPGFFRRADNIKSKVIHFPYSGRFGIVVTPGETGPIFVSGVFDPKAFSPASAALEKPWNISEKAGTSVKYIGPRENCRRARIILSVSDKLEDVLPTFGNPASPFLNIAGRKVIYFSQDGWQKKNKEPGGDAFDDINRALLLKKYGLDEILFVKPKNDNSDSSLSNLSATLRSIGWCFAISGKYSDLKMRGANIEKENGADSVFLYNSLPEDLTYSGNAIEVLKKRIKSPVFLSGGINDATVMGYADGFTGELAKFNGCFKAEDDSGTTNPWSGYATKMFLDYKLKILQKRSVVFTMGNPASFLFALSNDDSKWNTRRFSYPGTSIDIMRMYKIVFGNTGGSLAVSMGTDMQPEDFIKEYYLTQPVQSTLIRKNNSPKTIRYANKEKELLPLGEAVLKNYDFRHGRVRFEVNWGETIVYANPTLENWNVNCLGERFELGKSGWVVRKIVDGSEKLLAGSFLLGNKKIDTSITDNCLFLDTNGHSIRFRGIRTDGRIIVKKTDKEINILPVQDLKIQFKPSWLRPGAEKAKGFKSPAPTHITLFREFVSPDDIERIEILDKGNNVIGTVKFANTSGKITIGVQPIFWSFRILLK